MKIGKVTLFERREISNGRGGKNTVLYYLIRSPWIDIDVRSLHEDGYVSAGAPMHNHGVEMYRLCLWGGYDELRSDHPRGWVRKVRPGTINHLPKDTFHYIVRQVGDPSWTIGFATKWRGSSKPQFLVDGEPVSMIDWISEQGKQHVAYSFAKAIDAPVE